MRSFKALTALALCLAIVLPAQADHFPGKGDQAKWNEAQEYYRSGCNAKSSKNFTVALQDLSKAISIYADDERYYSARADALKKMGEYDAAIRDYMSAVSVSGGERIFWEALAEACFLAKKWNDCNMTINSALLAAGKNPNAVKEVEDTTRYYKQQAGSAWPNSNLAYSLHSIRERLAATPVPAIIQNVKASRTPSNSSAPVGQDLSWFFNGGKIGGSNPQAPSRRPGGAPAPLTQGNGPSPFQIKGGNSPSPSNSPSPYRSERTTGNGPAPFNIHQPSQVQGFSDHRQSIANLRKSPEIFLNAKGQLFRSTDLNLKPRPYQGSARGRSLWASAERSFLLGLAEAKRGNHATALSYFQSAADTKPDESIYRLNAGVAAFYAGKNLSQSVSDIKSAATISSGDFRPWLNLAIVSHFAGKKSESLEAARKSLLLADTEESRADATDVLKFVEAGRRPAMEKEAPAPWYAI